jgi:hypothetical protein
MSKVNELLIGTKGRIYCAEAKLVASDGKVLYQYDKQKENNPYQTEHDVLFEAIAKGEFKFADGEIGAKSSMTAIMGRMATYSGQVLEWDKLLANPISIMPTSFAWNAAPPVVPNEQGMYPVAVPGKTKYA